MVAEFQFCDGHVTGEWGYDGKVPAGLYSMAWEEILRLFNFRPGFMLRCRVSGIGKNVFFLFCLVIAVFSVLDSFTLNFQCFVNWTLFFLDAF